MATNDNKTPGVKKPAENKPAVVKTVTGAKPAAAKSGEKKPAKAKKPNRLMRPVMFLKEVVAEVKKLAWPTMQELASRTGAVLAFVLAAAALIFVLDLVFSGGVTLIMKIAG